MKIMDNVTYKCVVYTKDVDGEEEEEKYTYIYEWLVYKLITCPIIIDKCWIRNDIMFYLEYLLWNYDYRYNTKIELVSLYG